jgi:hypothetical protein
LLTFLGEPSYGPAWLVGDGEVPVGYILLTFGRCLEYLGRDGFIDQFFLRESHRGRGWGRPTLDFVEEQARAAGVCSIHLCSIHLEVVRSNPTAKAVCRRAGYSDHEHCLMSQWIERGFAKPGTAPHCPSLPLMKGFAGTRDFAMLSESRPRFCEFPIHRFKEIDVFPRLAFRLTGLLLLTLGCFPASAQQFSADMVRLKPVGSPVSRVFVSGDRMRFEVTGQPQDRASVVLLDLKLEAGFIVLNENKSYMPLASGTKSAAMPFFHPADPDNACPAWEKAVAKPGSCTKVGAESVQGRDTVKYKGTAANGDTGYIWVDRELNFVIKWQGENGAVEFQKIAEGPQPPTLFEIPKGYDKIDPQAERAKAAQSKKQKTKALAPKITN